MNESNLVSAYAKLRPQYSAFTTSVRSLLETVLEAERVEYFSTEVRTKTTDSLSEKIGREDKAGKYKSVEDITDLSGVRIIAYLQEDCDRICEILERILDIDVQNSVRKQEELDPDKFGYLSVHYVASLPVERTILPEYTRFAGLKVEIQIRTLLQHTWAAIDWKFRYKEEREAPKNLRRRLFRISALLEAADNEFSSVKIDMDKLAKAYEEEIRKSNLDIQIDTESLKSYIATSNSAKSIMEAARSAGLTVPSTVNSSAIIGKLATTAKLLNLNTLRDIDNRLSSMIDEAEEFFSYIIANRKAVPGVRNTGQLMATAAIRYALIPTATNIEINNVFKRAPVSLGYEDAIHEYAVRRASQLRHV